jgi:hypothetical protein
MARASQPSMNFPSPPNSGSTTQNVQPALVSLHCSISSIFGDGAPTTREKTSCRPSPWYITISSSFKQGCKRITNDPWVLEYLAATLAISAVAALIAVLAQANDLPQHAFTIGNTQVTLNTLVAAISTVTRAALLVTLGGTLSQSPGTGSRLLLVSD